MDFNSWTEVAGILLLLMSLAYGGFNRTPVPLFGLYLIIGIIFGPWFLRLVNIDIVKYATLISHFTEIAMAASLFITGLKIRMPLKSGGWKTGALLAGPGMLLTVAGVTIAAHWLLNLSWPCSLALAAIVAPTDPVLASIISISDARDTDRLRLSLSAEAGLNDGTALPLLMLAAMLFTSKQAPGEQNILDWFAIDVVWALGAGLTIGFMLGRGLGLVSARFRHTQREFASTDFIALALICLSFASAMMLGASGFLAAFAAGVGLRNAELKTHKHFPDERYQTDSGTMPAETVVNPHTRHGLNDTTRIQSLGLVIGDALTFGDTIERFFAAAIIIVLGITLAQHWQPDGFIIAAALFFIIRPVAVMLVTAGSSITIHERLIKGWLGIRGIGSLNYIAWAWLHGIRGEEASYMIDCALTLVVSSIILHGITAAPIMALRSKIE